MSSIYGPVMERLCSVKVNEASATEAFTTHEEFDDYLDQISNA